MRNLIGKRVIVKLIFGLECHGRLVSTDRYMCLQLEDVDIYAEEEVADHVRKLFIRSNNILHIRGAEDDNDGGLM